MFILVSVLLGQLGLEDSQPYRLTLESKVAIVLICDNIVETLFVECLSTVQ